jgi:hypothetical protein
VKSFHESHNVVSFFSSLIVNVLSAVSPSFVETVALSMKNPCDVSARVMSRISPGRSGAMTRTDAVNESTTLTERDARSLFILGVKDFVFRVGKRSEVRFS